MMLWSNEILRFQTPFGEAAVNGSADGWGLNSCDPAAIMLAVESTLSATKRPPHPHYAAICREAPRDGDPEAFRRWLETVVATPTGWKQAPHARTVHLLEELRLVNVLLWPSAVYALPHPCGPGIKLMVTGGKTPFELDVTRSVMAQVGPEKALLMSCSPIHSVDDLSEEALLAAVRVSLDSAAWTVVWKHTITTFFRRIEGSERSNGTSVEVLARAQDMMNARGDRRQEVDRFGPAARRDDAEPWLRHFENASSRTRLKHGSHQNNAFADWLEYLSTRDSIIEPGQVTREADVTGPSGFLHWLGSRIDPHGRQYRRKLTLLQDMFALIVSQGEMAAIPIHDGDLPACVPDDGISNKLVVPREIMEMLRTVARELIAFAFLQFASLGEQPWKPAGKVLTSSPAALALAGRKFPLPDTLLDPVPFRWLLVTLRSPDGAFVRVVNPSLPTVLLTLLRMINRSIEVALVDSGEADELIADVEEKTAEDGRIAASISWRRNNHPLATPGRHLGVIQEREDRERGQRVAGFYINTNKSQPGGHADGKDRGHFIPWQDPELLLAFFGVRRWHERLNPVDRVLSREELSRQLAVSDGLKGLLPGYCYLFRNLNDRNLASRHQPFSHNDIQRMYKMLLDEVEARLALRSTNGASPPAKGPAQPGDVE